MKRIFVLFIMIGFAAGLALAQTHDSTTADQPAQPIVVPQTLPTQPSQSTVPAPPSPPAQPAQPVIVPQTLPTQPLQSTVPAPPSPPAQIEQPEVVHPVVPPTLDVRPEKNYGEDSTKAK